MPGIGGQTFTIQFEEGWFHKTGFFSKEAPDHIIDRMVDRYNTQSLD